MEPVLVLFARGAVNDSVNILCDVARAMGYTLWSLGGNPCSVGMKLPVNTKRVSILHSKDISSDQIRDEDMIGTVEVSISSHVPKQCRITFHVENLAGESLRRPELQTLQRFSAKTYMLLKADDMLIEEVEPGAVTRPFYGSNATVDTSPI